MDKPLSKLKLDIEKIEQAKKRGIEVKIHSDSIHVSPADPKGPMWFFYFQTLSELMMFFEVFNAFINNDELYEHVGKLKSWPNQGNPERNISEYPPKGGALMVKPNSDPECSCCKNGIEETRRMQRECMEKYGWYCHNVAEGAKTPTGFCIHTHGMQESFNHPDLQIILPLQPETAHGVLVSAVNLAKESGLTPGEKYEKVLKNFSVKAMWAREGDRPVIRIILPDKHNHLEKEDLDEDYAQQYEETSYEQF